MDIETCSLLDLPAELLLLIIDACSHQRDLSAWSRTSHSFHSIITPALYGIEICKNRWHPVFWAAENGVVGTLRSWSSVRNTDGSIRAPFDVYTTRNATIWSLIRDSGVYRIGERVLGPIDPTMRERYAPCHAPLHVAAKQGHKDVVEFLLDNGADINAHSVGLLIGGMSVFHDARDRVHPVYPQCVTLNALHVAIASGHAEVAKVLVRRGIDMTLAPLRAGQDSDITALHLAAAHSHFPGNLDVLRLIGELPGIDVNAPDIDGQTPLMYAAESNDKDPSISVFAALRDLGADIDGTVRTPHGMEASLIVTLIRRNRWRAVIKLIDLGADLEVQEGQRTLLEECKRAGMSVIHPEKVDDEAYERLITRLEHQVSAGPRQDVIGQSKHRKFMKRLVRLGRSE